MVRPVGATYADAIIAAIDVARGDPIKFLVTVPLSLALVAVIVVTWYRLRRRFSGAEAAA